MGSCCNKDRPVSAGGRDSDVATNSTTQYNGLKLRVPRDVEDNIRRGKQFVYLLPSSTTPSELHSTSTAVAWERREFHAEGFITPMAAANRQIPRALPAASDVSEGGPQRYCIVPRHIDRYIRHVSTKMTFLTQQEQHQLVVAVLSRSARYNDMQDSNPRKLYLPKLSHRPTSFKVYREMTFYLPDEEEDASSEQLTSRRREESFRAESYGISQNEDGEPPASDDDDESNDTPPLGCQFVVEASMLALPRHGTLGGGNVPSLPSLHELSALSELMLPNAIGSQLPGNASGNDDEDGTHEDASQCFLLSPATLRMHNRPSAALSDTTGPAKDYVSIVWMKAHDDHVVIGGGNDGPTRLNKIFDKLSVFSCPPSCLRRPVRNNRAVDCPRRRRQVRFDDLVELKKC